MSQDEGRKRDGRLSGLTSALRRRHDDRIEVSGYQVGDVRAENAVVILAGGFVVGDILAPEVVVNGLIYGYVACRRLAIAPGGQIWGDVYVSSLEMAPSGKINGWVCTLDSGTVDLLRAGELGKGDLPEQGARHLPAELLQRIEVSGADIEADQMQSQRRSGIWRQLRSEAALALIARSEIETTFDQRLELTLSERVSGHDKTEPTLDPEPGEANADDVTQANVDLEPPGEDSVSDDRWESAEVNQLRAQLRQATAAAQKYYGELLWTRAELRAARREDGID